MQSGFFLDKGNAEYGPDMECYTLRPEVGSGHYWLYTCDDLFTISIQDFIYYSDFFVESEQGKAISVTHIESASGEELRPYKRLSCNYIRGHVAGTGLYQARLYKSIPVRSTGIEMMPAYYENYLQHNCPGQYRNPKDAFMGVDGTKNFPELIVVMKQLKNFKGSGMSARLYYSGKVAEAISLIFEKTLQENAGSLNKPVITAKDKEYLAAVAAYIDDHYAFPIHLDELAHIACMGTTKLKNTFRDVYRCTITEYILNKRIAQAEHLLTNTNFSIQQISEIVGYKQAISFTKSFSKTIGMLPSEYRKLVKRS